MFSEGDIVIAKNEFLDEGEAVQDTVGVVVDYNPENDYLTLGTLHPEGYAIPPMFNMRGECYRYATEDDLRTLRI